jgi:cell division protein FtsQ
MARRNRRLRSSEEKRESRSRWLNRLILAPTRWLLLSALGVGLGFGAYRLVVFVRTSPVLTVRSIEVRGTINCRTESLLRAGQLQEGMNIFSVDSAAVAKKLRAHSWIRRAHVSRVVPDRIVVEVEEYVPVALINLEGLYYLDAEGEVFKRLQPGEALDLPILTGISREAYHADPERARRRILEALGTLERLKKQSCLAGRRVAEIHLDELTGLTVLLDPGALALRFGPGDLGNRLQLSCRVLDEIGRRRLKVHTVMLNHEHRPGWATVQLEAYAAEPKLPSKKASDQGER